MDNQPDVATAPPPSPTADPPTRGWLGAGALGLGIVVLGGALGAAGGWFWYRWWGPPGEGEVYETSRGPLWLDTADQARTHAFDAIAQFVVIGVTLGLVLGLVAAIVGRRRPLGALAAVCAASAVGALLAARVGFQLSPPDPQTLADEVEIGAKLSDGLVLDGWTPYLCWPVGALVGFLAVMLSSKSVSEVRRSATDGSTWLEARPRR